MCFSDMAPVVVLAEVLVSAIAGGGGADVHSLVGLGLFGWKIFGLIVLLYMVFLLYFGFTVILVFRPSHFVSLQRVVVSPLDIIVEVAFGRWVVDFGGFITSVASFVHRRPGSYLIWVALFAGIFVSHQCLCNLFLLCVGLGGFQLVAHLAVGAVIGWS